ncbi:MAG: aromatic ring-hydroxylating dioxygenase subunit alpha [Okeania sp. SIO2H7]|nr:aromatic ring-hydroxylating dioxygenase subunit alpha [Okeania sp. SIO2H7]
MSFTTKNTEKCDVRQLGINPNYWYVVARSSEVVSDPLAVTLWHQAIVLYRDSQGQVRALEDRCPHRLVKLSDGLVVGDTIECSYHGWGFNSRGECVEVPYLGVNQKLPGCKIRSFPVEELDGFIWLWPGSQGSQGPEDCPLGVREWDNLNYIATVSEIRCKAHYSFLIENLMDMHHGHLHRNWQPWAAAALENLQEGDRRIDVFYQAQCYFKIDKIWSVSQLFFPALRRLHSVPLIVSYVYPHWQSSLGEDFKIYCLLCPVSETETKAYLIHFTSLEAFKRLHKLPIWFRRFIKNSFFNSARRLLDGLVREDVKMIEEEQRAYLECSQRRGYELNPAVGRVQRFTIEIVDN